MKQRNKEQKEQHVMLYFWSHEMISRFLTDGDKNVMNCSRHYIFSKCDRQFPKRENDKLFCDFLQF